jgi:BTB/POZ domain-containing protein KCTD9
MGTESQARLGYAESCHKLQEAGWLDPGEIPPLPVRRPSHDDSAPLGVSFFRTRVSGYFSNMTLSRTFFGRSEVAAASFKNCDLSESTLCWNDFTGVDFSYCDLRMSDLRASIFNGVNFSHCDLREADLRRASFDDCDFSDADLRGTKMTRRQAARLNLSSMQKESVAFQATDGEEPGGG